MTADKNTGPGEDALRHLSTERIREDVEIYERDLKGLPRGQARRIIEGLIDAGKKELEMREQRGIE